MAWYNRGNIIESPGGACDAPGMSHQEVPPMTAPEHTIPTLICNTCRQELPVTAFEPRPGVPRGYCGSCRPCRVKRRRNDPAQVARKHHRDRSRHKKPGPTPIERNRARWRVRNHRVQGNIVRPEFCSECKRLCKPEAHHEDYSRPLDVVWLCRACHAKRHRKYT